MRRCRNRIIVVTLVSVILVLLISCNTDEQEDNTEPAEYVYTSEYIPLPRDIGNINNITYYNDKIYFVASAKNQVTVAGQYGMLATIASVYSINLDGTELTEVTDILPTGIPDDANIKSNIALTTDDEGNIWFFVRWSYYTPGYYEYIDSGIDLLKMNRKGIQLLSIDLSNYLRGMMLAQNDFPEIVIQSQNQEASSTDGELIYISYPDFINGNQTIYVFNNQGILLVTDSIQNPDAQVIKMPDGTVAVFDGDGVMYSPDFSSGKFIKNNDCPITGILAASDINADAIFKFIDSTGEFDVLVNDNNNLIGIDTDQKNTTALLNWKENSVSIYNVKEIKMLPDGRIVCLYTRMIGDNHEKAVLIILEKIPRSRLSQIIEITLAGVGITDTAVIDAVYDFNATNKEYCIQVVDYLKSDINTDVQRLNLDIMSGKVPDIFFTENLPYATYARAGLFADLYTFIDTDPEYNRDSFIQGALRAAEYDGRLYRVFSGFLLNSIIADPAIAGPDTGWNLDEFEAMLDAHPGADIPIGSNYSSSDFLRNGGIAAVIDEYINWETGVVNFDSPQFIRFLEVTKRLGMNVMSQHPNPIEGILAGFIAGGTDSFSYHIRDGRQIMLLTQIGNFTYNYTFPYSNIFNADIVIKGFPNNIGNGNVYGCFIESLAIADNSQNKDAAWSFVRTVLDEEWQLDSNVRRAGSSLGGLTGFASNRTAFMKHAEAIMANQAESVNIGHLSQERAITQKDIDKIIDMINSAVCVLDLDDIIIEIIIEEAENYFNGIQSVEDAARIIHSRVSIYLLEHK